MILAIGILGTIFSVCVLRLMQPLLTYKRLEIEMIYFLEWVKLICFIVITVRAL